MGERGWVSDTITRAAATNVDLHKAVEQGRFRRDFLDRLEVLTPQLPTLRERVEDFALLMEHFFEVANEEEGTDVGPPAPTDARRLARECGHTSIRVMKNAIRRLVVVKRKGVVRAKDLIEAGLLAATSTEDCGVEVEAGPHGTTQVELQVADGTPLRVIIAQVGRAVTDVVLRKHNGDVAGAIQELGVSKSAWYRARKP